MSKKLPIGIEFFSEMRTEDYYYVDKTLFIRDLLEYGGKINLFTRPRRFGKSLGIDMLKAFFERGGDPRLFEGLAISEEKEICEHYMGRFPVISLSLKSVMGHTFDAAKESLRTLIGMEASRFSFLLESDRLSTDEKAIYHQLIAADDGARTVYGMSDEAMRSSLQLLSALLFRHFGEKAVILIDEYDVPLDKAEHYGYYEEMALLIRSLLGNALKTNEALQTAVLTGCLRISKESIFTGLNNLKVFSVTDAAFASFFGFTDAEVRTLLEHYGLSAHYDTVRQWYDGYRFGKTDIYCPWDVMNCCSALRADPGSMPGNFWVNTSGNDIVERFVRMASYAAGLRDELEHLIAGDAVEKEIHPELTYHHLFDEDENIWSVLLMTGYLTQAGQGRDGRFLLRIPNEEIRSIFKKQVYLWFAQNTRKNAVELNAFCEAFRTGDADEIERRLNAYLASSISIRDTAARTGRRENFYHGILLGMLAFRRDWVVRSNSESGDGYGDILIEIPTEQTGIVIEVKYADSSDLERACLTALEQIETRQYSGKLEQDDMTKILKYGIACRKKRCRVMMAPAVARQDRRAGREASSLKSEIKDITKETNNAESDTMV